MPCHKNMAKWTRPYGTAWRMEMALETRTMSVSVATNQQANANANRYEQPNGKARRGHACATCNVRPDAQPDALRRLRLQANEQKLEARRQIRSEQIVSRVSEGPSARRAEENMKMRRRRAAACHLIRLVTHSNNYIYKEKRRE